MTTISMQHSPSWEANSFSPSQKIRPFYGNKMFITGSKRPTSCPYPETEELSQ